MSCLAIKIVLNCKLQFVEPEATPMLTLTRTSFRVEYVSSSLDLNNSTLKKHVLIFPLFQIIDKFEKKDKSQIIYILYLYYHHHLEIG